MRRRLLMILLAGVAACSTPPAPVVERSGKVTDSAPVAEGHYRIRSGDTLHGIAFRFGLDHRELARWNSISPPYLIYPDQVLKLSGPAAPGVPAPASQAEVKTESRVARAAPRPATRQPASPTPKTSQATEQAPAQKAPATQALAEKPEPREPAAIPESAPQSWVWPVDGRVLRGFLANDPSRNGLDITANEGQAVRATAAGSVVYSGNGLIGFGELIIIKHSEQMLSAYAHNRARLVAEGDRVRQGQKIAEVGRNDRNETLLHFEIRANGKPVDPRKYLPRK